MEQAYLDAIREIEQEENVVFPTVMVQDMSRKKWEFNHVEGGRPDHFQCAVSRGQISWHYWSEPITYHRLYKKDDTMIYLYSDWHIVIYTTKEIPDQLQEILEKQKKPGWKLTCEYPNYVCDMYTIDFPQYVGGKSAVLKIGDKEFNLEATKDNEVKKWMYDEIAKFPKKNIYKDILRRPIRCKFIHDDDGRKISCSVKKGGDHWRWEFGDDNQGGCFWYAFYTDKNEEPVVKSTYDDDPQDRDDVIYDNFEPYTQKFPPDKDCFRKNYGLFEQAFVCEKDYGFDEWPDD